MLVEFFKSKLIIFFIINDIIVNNSDIIVPLKPAN